jgi:hypothetical protein
MLTVKSGILLNLLILLGATKENISKGRFGGTAPLILNFDA